MEFTESSFELHKEIGIRYSHGGWIKRRIKGLGFVEGIDFEVLLVEHPSIACLSQIKEYKLTVEASDTLRRFETSPAFQAYENAEKRFFHNLDLVLNNIDGIAQITIERHVKCGKYYIDGFIGEYGICLEFDEEQHESPKHKKEDLIRQDYIEHSQKCVCIRIKVGEEMESIGKIISHILNNR